ncbi:MAG: hypothetical protein ACRCW1_07200 [Anaerotignaceae bacterium]
MTNKQKAILKKYLKKDNDFITEFQSYNFPTNREHKKYHIIGTYNNNLNTFLDYIQEEIKEYLKEPNKNEYQGAIYTLDKQYLDIEYIVLDNKLIINLEALYNEYKEFLYEL